MEAGTPDADSVAAVALPEAYALRSDTAADDSASEPLPASRPAAAPPGPLLSSRCACRMCDPHLVWLVIDVKYSRNHLAVVCRSFEVRMCVGMRSMQLAIHMP